MDRAMKPALPRCPEIALDVHFSPPVSLAVAGQPDRERTESRPDVTARLR
jgi:hypothetical protein